MYVCMEASVCMYVYQINKVKFSKIIILKSELSHIVSVSLAESVEILYNI
jgi:hypothetical protein